MIASGAERDHVLILKLLLVPALIGLASIVGRRWGPAAGGWFVALPLTSGPLVMIIAIERGAAFAADASVGVVLGVIALTAFTLAYAWSARGLTWPWCSAFGCASFLICARTLAVLSVSLPTAFLLGCGSLLVGLRLMPRSTPDRHHATDTSRNIPLRMALAAILVLGVTSAAGRLGPRVSGLLTPFPIAALLLAAFTHHVDGSAAAARLLRGLLTGLFAFALFFLVVGASVERLGTVAAFATATLGALAVQAATWRFRTTDAEASEQMLTKVAS